MRVLGELLDLLLPQWCAGCGAEPGLLCVRCGGLLGPPARPAAPTPPPPGLPAVWAVARYEGAVRAMIVAHKESGRAGLARPLGAALAAAVLAAASGAGVDAPVMVVPVPSTRAAVRQRGHDPTLRVTAAAVAALRALGVPACRVAALAHARRVADQSGLTVVGRAANLSGALRALRPGEVSGRRVVVVDDVMTTGCTLAEAARALRVAGADVPVAAVVAATPRKHRPP